MIMPRYLHVENARVPKVNLPSEGGAPGIIRQVEQDVCKREIDRACRLYKPLYPPIKFGKLEGDFSSVIGLGTSDPCEDFTLSQFVKHLADEEATPPASLPKNLRKSFDPKPRQLRQLHELDRHNQHLLDESSYVRRDFMPIADQFARPDDKKKLDTSSVAAYQKSVERYREYYANEVVGRFDHKLLPANPRTRLHSESDKWAIYQVVLDVFPDVIAYGLLVIPKDLKDGEKRPVVVCQHGLEGRPEHVIGKEGFAYYKAFATQLAERGFITFAPQNLYIFHDRFRSLQRKANPIKKTLFSVIVPQHQQITDWLKTLPFVDGSRIGFYGLSYGGKSAMRIPPLVSNYCLSICSADFNEWVWKNASSRLPLQLRVDGRVRDLRVRPGQHLQLCRDGRPDRSPAVHGRARPFRRRGARMNVSHGSSPRCGTCTRRSSASATAPPSNGSSGRTRSTARGRLSFCTGI